MAAVKKEKNTITEAAAGRPDEQLSLKNHFFNISLAANSIADPNGSIIHANAAFVKMWGYHALDDVIGKHIGDFFEQKDEAAAILDVLNERGSWEGTFVALKTDGSPFNAHGLATIIRDENGTVLGYQSTVLDITRRTRAESQLNEAQRIAHIGSWELDLVMNTLWWSDEIYRIFEIDREKFGASYEAFLDTIHPDDRYAVNAAYTDSVDNHVPYSIVHRLLFPDGRMKYVHERCETHYSAAGQPLRSVGTVQDITEQKRAEATLLRINRALRTISACNQILVRTTTETELMQEICKAIVTEGNYRFAWIGYSENEQTKRILPIFHAGADDGYLEHVSITWDDTPRGRGPTGTAYRTRRPVVCRNMLTDPKFSPWKDEAIKRGYASSIALPLHYKESMVGVLSVYAVEPDAFHQEEEALLTELADDLAYGVMSLRLRIAHQRIETKMAVFSHLGQQLNSSTTPHEAAKKIADAAQNLFGWDAFTMDMYLQKEDLMHSLLNIDTINGVRQEVPPRNITATPNPEMRRIIERGAILYLRDAGARFENDFVPFGDDSRPSHSLMFAPIRSLGNVIGIVSIQSYALNAYQQSDLEILQSLADYCSGALERICVTDEIRKNEAHYRSFFEENLAGTFVSTPDGTLVDCNKAFLQIFRIASLEEAKRTNVATLYADTAKRHEFLQTLMTDKKIQYFEFTAVRKDGTRAYIVENAVGRFDNDGNLLEIQGFIFDDTKRRELEHDLMQAQKLESLGTIAGGVAHDFNNILGIIMAHATMLDRWRNDPDRFNQGVAAVVKATNRGAALVKQLLTIARKTEINFHLVQINDILKEVTRLLQETFPKLITIATSLRDDLPFILADSTQLHQVALNLCVNARDAMPNGGILTIATTIAPSLKDIFPRSKSSDYVCLEVSDTGCGMDESTQRRIFEPFFTTKEQGKGTGLGLSLVFSIVENHHGFVDVRSAVGAGTTFKIFLPTPEQMKETTTGDKRPDAEIPGGSETILVIEDEEMLRSLLEVFLTNKGYAVITANDGSTGVEQFRAHADSISLVLSDLGLPGLSGDAVFRQIKKINPRVKTILASGYIDPEKKSQLYQSGVTHFIQKPYSDKDVLQKIRIVLDSDQ